MSKKVIEPINVLLNGNMSGSLQSSPSTVKYMDNISYQCVFTGSPVGTFDVQVSLDNAQDGSGQEKAPTHWAPLGLAIPTSGGSPQFIDINQTGACQIRLIYTAVSGSGTLNVTMASKEV